MSVQERYDDVILDTAHVLDGHGADLLDTHIGCRDRFVKCETPLIKRSLRLDNIIRRAPLRVRRIILSQISAPRTKGRAEMYRTYGVY